MTQTEVVDVDEALYLRQFGLEEECKGVVDWCREHDIVRPESFDERLEVSVRLKEIGNDKFRAQDHRAAVMHMLGALHCLDFSQGQTDAHDESQKRRVVVTMCPVLAILSFMFLKRGDDLNAERAADIGLDRVKRLGETKESKALEAKMLHRRGLAKGQRREFEAAHTDLKEAATLQPQNAEIRRVLENCKTAVRLERGAPDDRWRGLLTEDPELQGARRWVQLCKMATKELISTVMEAKVATVMLVLPLFLLGAVIFHKEGMNLPSSAGEL